MGWPLFWASTVRDRDWIIDRLRAENRELRKLNDALEAELRKVREILYAIDLAEQREAEGKTR